MQMEVFQLVEAAKEVLLPTQKMEDLLQELAKVKVKALVQAAATQQLLAVVEKDQPHPKEKEVQHKVQDQDKAVPQIKVEPSQSVEVVVDQLVL